LSTLVWQAPRGIIRQVGRVPAGGRAAVADELTRRVQHAAHEEISSSALRIT